MLLFFSHHDLCFIFYSVLTSLPVILCPTPFPLHLLSSSSHYLSFLSYFFFFLITYSSSSLSLLFLSPLSAHRLLCTDRIGFLHPMIRLTLIFMKKGEDEVVGGGGVGEDNRMEMKEGEMRGRRSEEDEMRRSARGSRWKARAELTSTKQFLQQILRERKKWTQQDFRKREQQCVWVCCLTHTHRVVNEPNVLSSKSLKLKSANESGS